MLQVYKIVFKFILINILSTLLQYMYIYRQVVLISEVIPLDRLLFQLYISGYCSIGWVIYFQGYTNLWEVN